MTAAALLLFLVGSADLVRARGNTVATWCIVPVVWIAGLWFAIALRTPWWGWLVAIAVAIFWWATMRRRGSADAPRIGLVPIAVFFVALVALLLTSGVPQSEWRIDGWTLDPATLWFADVPAGGIAMTIAVAVFLLESANMIVRAALRDELFDAESTAGQSTDRVRQQLASELAIDQARSRPRRSPRHRRWWQRASPGPGSEPKPGSATATDRPTPTSTLKGGRLIGPLERLVLVALLLTNAYAVVAAIIAAKGIVRFPEISKDGATGRNAETFLVGSMVSWALAVGGSGLVWLAFQ